MAPKLTDDQRHALDAKRGAPVFVEDDQRHVTYVLVSLRAYERVRPLFEDADFPIRESYPLQNAIANSAGWNDPRMDAYDRLAIPPENP
jgi:hypothetical protein